MLEFSVQNLDSVMSKNIKFIYCKPKLYREIRKICHFLDLTLILVQHTEEWSWAKFCRYLYLHVVMAFCGKKTRYLF